MKEFKYKAFFSSVIRPVISKDKDLYLAKASLEQLRGFIPDINPDINYDLLPIAVPLFNVNYFNKNDDGVDTAFALQVYKTFINKFFDLNHKRDLVIGTILSAHITEFGTDKLLTEDDIKDTKEVFNITVGGILWKSINEGLTELIEESNNILDENYDKIKASLEIGFSDFRIVKCPANSRSLSEGTIIDDPKDVEKLSKNLKAFGGTGKLNDGSRVYRLLSGEGLGLGAGITESPAAFLNAIATPQTETEAIIKQPDITLTINDIGKDISKDIRRNIKETLIKECQVGGLLEHLQKVDNKLNISSEELATAIERAGKSTNNLEEIISQTNKQDVINDKNLNSRKHMKINDIKDITDELLKEVKASNIVDFVEDKLKIASEQFAKEKKEKETAAQELQRKHDEMIKNHENLQKDLETLKSNLQKLEQEKANREKQEVFSARMASFEDKFELVEEEIAVVGSQIKDLNDEQYKKVEANLHVLLKNKDKQLIAERKKAVKVLEIKASEVVKEETKSAQETIDKAVEASKTITKEIAATSTVQTQSLREKYAKAFNRDQFDITK